MTRQGNRAYRQENTRRNGWDMNLYRNTHEKMIAGVGFQCVDVGYGAAEFILDMDFDFLGIVFECRLM